MSHHARSPTPPAAARRARCWATRCSPFHGGVGALTTITFNDAGEIVRQVDTYDGLQTLATLFEAKLGFVGRGLRRFAGWVGPILRELIRAFYRLFEKDRPPSG